jgi:hypothetical protein
VLVRRLDNCRRDLDRNLGESAGMLVNPDLDEVRMLCGELIDGGTRTKE